MAVIASNNGSQIYLYILIFIVVALIGYWLWTSHKVPSSEPEVPKQPNINYESDSEPEEVEITIPENFKIQNKEFVVTDINNQSEPSTNDQITYHYFKQIYLSPKFLESYKLAIRDALKIKRKKLIQIRRQYAKDYLSLNNTSKNKGVSEGMNNLLQSLNKDQDVKMLESTLGEIDLLLEEVNRKTKELTLDLVKKNLILAFTDKRNGIDSIYGREEVKDFLALQLYTFAQNPKIFYSTFQNMAILGPSGIGKSKLGQVIGHVYASSGIILRNHVHIITKQSLTTAYVNESARITRKLLLANLESVVFIDEAYDLTPPDSWWGGGIDHGREAITEMVNFMDKMMGLSIIIVAGYEREMETRFMNANEGIPRRFPHKLILPPYTAKELTNILVKFLLETCPDIRLPEDHGNYIYTIINYINKRQDGIFDKQAGDMLILSGHIARAIYGTRGKSWPTDAEDIITVGFRKFLHQKGLTLESLN